MPKPIREIERDDAERSRPLTERILAVLEAERESAFDVFELYAKTSGFDPNTVALVFLAIGASVVEARLRPYRDALTSLVEAGRAREFSNARGGPYYAAT